ncbi:MAG: hypothetical protein EPO12_01050 [Aquabacterium sp.]|nr:MAG: hypothetical protein EPO12_01050 [Aquabacterium sp.]
MRKLARTALAALALALGQAAMADSVRIPITGTLGGDKGVPLVDIKIKDKDGKEITVKGIVDTGSNSNLNMNQKLADQLGLAAGTAAQSKGVGGTANIKNTDVPAGNGGSFSGATASDATKFDLPVKGPARVSPGIPDGHVLVGSALINSDPAGPGSVSVNWAKKTVTIHNNTQAKALAVLQLDAPLQLAELGTFYAVGGPSSAWAVNVGATNAGTTVDASFVLSTGVDHSFISAGLAAALGLSPQGSVSVTTGGGTFTGTAADVELQVFSEEGPVSFSVGVLSPSDNPDGINVLGADFLQRYAEVQINGGTLTFSATAVPEPSFGWLWMGGLVAMRAGINMARRRS